jgi:hypothetical protein
MPPSPSAEGASRAFGSGSDQRPDHEQPRDDPDAKREREPHHHPFKGDPVAQLRRVRYLRAPEKKAEPDLGQEGRRGRWIGEEDH